MAKKINIIANLIDKQFRQQVQNLENGKYKINVDVNNENVDRTTNQMRQLGSATTSTNTTFGKLKNTIGNTFSTTRMTMTAFLTVLNEIHKAGKNAKQTIEEIDQAITDLSIATNMSREATANLVKDYNNYAKELKNTTTQITSAADDWLRAGKSMSEAKALIKDSIMLSKLGKIDSSVATEDLLATMNGYEMSIEQVGKALDAMVSIDMVAATSSGDLATGLKYSASSASSAGMSFDKLVAILGTVQDKTQQTAEIVGTFANTMLSRYRDVTIGKYLSDDGEDISNYESVLKSVGISLRDEQGEFRSFETVLQEMADKWDSLSSVQQNALIKVAAGTRQQNRFIALMEGYNKVLQLTEVAANSAGTAVEKFNNSYTNSLEAKQNTLKASFESMVINSDFDGVYSGIIEATTALVDFINETNALKGVMTGLTVSSGIKFFLSVRTGINEAYISLNQFANALKIVKQTNISSGDFDRLLMLSNGLSDSQMKLLLSTKNLSIAQKELILMNTGLSAEEAKLQLQTWGMATAQTGLTAATTTLGNAFRGLFATMVANPIMLVTMAVSAGVMAYQSYNQKLEETRQKNLQASESAIDHANNLRELYSEYSRLSSIQNRTTSEEEDFKTAVEDITVALGNKAKILEGLTAGTSEYADALARATKEEFQSQAITATIGRKSAEEEFQKAIWSDWSGSKVSIDSNSKGKALSEEAQKAVNIVSDSLKEYETINRTWNNISWDISSDDPVKALEFYNALIKARDELVLASKSDEALLDTEIYSDLNGAIQTMSDSLDKYIEQRYEEEKLNYMAQNSVPNTVEEFNKMENAMMNVAGSSGDLQDKFKELLTADFSSLATDIENIGNAFVEEIDNSTNIISIDDARSAVTDLKEELDLIQKISSAVDLASDDYASLISKSKQYSAALKVEDGRLKVNNKRLQQVAKKRQIDKQRLIKETLQIKRQDLMLKLLNIDLKHFNITLNESIQEKYEDIQVLEQEISEYEALEAAINSCSEAMAAFQAAQQTNDQENYDLAKDAYDVIKGALTGTDSEGNESDFFKKYNTDDFQTAAEYLFSEKDYVDLMNATNIEEFEAVAKRAMDNIAPLMDPNNAKSAVNLFDKVQSIIESGEDIPLNDEDWAARLGISTDLWENAKQLGNLYDFNGYKIFQSEWADSLANLTNKTLSLKDANESLADARKIAAENDTEWNRKEVARLEKEQRQAQESYDNTIKRYSDDYRSNMDEYNKTDKSQSFDEFLTGKGYSDTDISTLFHSATKRGEELANQYRVLTQAADGYYYVTDEGATRQAMKEAGVLDEYKQLQELISNPIDMSGIDERAVQERKQNTNDLLEQMNKYTEARNNLKTAEENAAEAKSNGNMFEFAKYTQEADALRASLASINSEDINIQITSNMSQISGEIESLQSEIASLQSKAVKATSVGEYYSAHYQAQAKQNQVDERKSQFNQLSQFQEQMKIDAEVNYVLGEVEEPDNPQAEGTINYALGDVAKPDNPTVTGTINYKLGSVAKPATEGEQHNGTFNGFSSGTFLKAFANGTNVSLPRNERAVVNELGNEGLVRDGRLYEIQGGAQFMNLKRGDIIFNHQQMQDLMKHGYTNGRGRMIGGSHAEGSVLSAFARGSIVSNAYASPFNTIINTRGIGNIYEVSKSLKGSIYDTVSDIGDDIEEEAEENTAEFFDWIEIRLDRLQRLVDKWANQAEKAMNASSAAKYYDQEEKSIKTQLKNNLAGLAEYSNFLNALPLSPEYKQKVANGEIQIETIADEDLKQNISDFQTYYDKWLGIIDSFEEMAEKLYAIPWEKATKKIEELSEQIDLLGKQVDITNNYAQKATLIEKELADVNSQRVAANKGIKEAQKKFNTVQKETTKQQKKTKKNKTPWEGFEGKNTKAQKKNYKEAQKAVKKGEELDLRKFKEGSVAESQAKKYNAALRALNDAEKERQKQVLESLSKTQSLAKQFAELPLNEAKENIDKLTKAISLLDKQISNTVGATKKNILLLDEVTNKKAKTKESQKAYNSATSNLAKIMKTANSLGIKADGKNQADTSRFDVKSREYQVAVQYNEYLKALETATNDFLTAQQDEISEVRKAYKQMFDNVANDYSNLLSIIERGNKQLQNEMDIVTSVGRKVGASYYEAQKQVNDKQRETLLAEKKELEQKLNEAMQNGATVGTEEWLAMKSALDDVDDKLVQCTKNQIEYNKSFQKLDKEILDDIVGKLDNVKNEFEMIKTLMSKDVMFDDDGVYTDSYLATLGTEMVAYEVASQKLAKTRNQLAKIEELRNKGILGYYNSKEEQEQAFLELKKQEQDLLKDQFSQEEAIFEQAQKRLNAQMDAIKKLVDEKKKALSLEKDLYDYQKNIAKKTEDIAKLQKQISAYGGDTSEESMSIIQKLRNQLTEAQEDLDQTEYERYISDQEKMLDGLIEDYQEAIENYLKDFKNVVTNEMQRANLSIGVIVDRWNEVASDNGYFATTQELMNDNTTSITNSVSNAASRISNSVADSIDNNTTKIDSIISEMNRRFDELIIAIGNISTGSSYYDKFAGDDYHGNMSIDKEVISSDDPNEFTVTIVAPLSA